MRLVMLLLALMLFTPTAYSLPPLGAPKEAGVEQQKVENNDTIFTPVKRALVLWNARINREIPKHMRALKNDPSPTIIGLSILMAFLYGVFHTLGPGHGKMVVATYFLTQGTNLWRGAFVGIQVALAHVGGAVVLVFATDIALKSFITDPTAHAYYLKTISYGLIIAIGGFMLFQALRHLLGYSKATHSCAHCGHGHSHKHKTKTKKEMLISWGVGAIPCTGSLLILLYAMAHNVLWIGFLMVMCVAIGMAITMTLIGVLCIIGKKHIVDRYLSTKTQSHVWHIGLEALGASFIIFVGAMLMWATVV
jgi:nickel/cobalt exporter